jgi:hypothetical protein
MADLPFLPSSHDELHRWLVAMFLVFLRSICE